VFDESSAEGDVGDLRAATDAEGGGSAGDKLVDEGEFALVAFGVYGEEGGVGTAAVEGGVYVAAAGEDEAVEAGEEFFLKGFAGGDEDGDAAGAADGVYVGGGETEVAGVGAAGGSDADEGVVGHGFLVF
jgi:hypothetical protein